MMWGFADEISARAKERTASPISFRALNFFFTEINEAQLRLQDHLS